MRSALIEPSIERDVLQMQRVDKPALLRQLNNEVDFVLHRGPNLVGIEVKSGITAPRYQAISAFRQRFNPRSVLIVGADVTLDEFLSQPTDHWVDVS